MSFLINTSKKWKKRPIISSFSSITYGGNKNFLCLQNVVSYSPISQGVQPLLLLVQFFEVSTRKFCLFLIRMLKLPTNFHLSIDSKTLPQLAPARQNNDVYKKYFQTKVVYFETFFTIFSCKTWFHTSPKGS